MTISYYDRFAILPKRCDYCNRLFWMEPYNIRHKAVGIMYFDLKQIQCRECCQREKNERKAI